MKASTRMGLLLGAAGLMVVIGQEAKGFVGLSSRLAAVWTDASIARGEARPGTERLLKNPGSFVMVRRVVAEGVADAKEGHEVRISMPGRPEQTGARADAGEQTGKLIKVPDNTRAGDPAYAEWDEEEVGEWYVEEGDGTVFGPHGIAFAEGVDLGYTALAGHGPEHRRRAHRERRNYDVPEYGADDLHRSAQLRFAEAAQPHLAGQDDVFRRAQLAFHRATLAPGVQRQSDGLRHERTPSHARPRGRR